MILFFVGFIIYALMRCLPTSFIENMARQKSMQPGSKSFDEWMEQLTGYLRENRDHAVAYMKENGFPLTPVIPEGSFLLWIDGRDSGIDPEHMSDYFLNRCHIYLNNGADFGADGVGFFRMNFGVTKSVLEDALRRMKEAFAADGLLK